MELVISCKDNSLSDCIETYVHSAISDLINVPYSFWPHHSQNRDTSLGKNMFFLFQIHL
jgi:hypothetical protein